MQADRLTPTKRHNPRCTTSLQQLAKLLPTQTGRFDDREQQAGLDVSVVGRHCYRLTPSAVDEIVMTAARALTFPAGAL